MSLAPVAVFAYNRPDHLRRTLESLARNPSARERTATIYADAPRAAKDEEAVAKVRDYLKTVSGFREVRVVEREENFGLARSIVTGVSETIEERGEVIVLEDDMVVSPHFLEYMDDALRRYADDERVISAHGYVYPVRRRLPETFFLRGADCWGWATWRRAWAKFEPDGEALLRRLVERDLVAVFDYDGEAGYMKMLRRQINGEVDSWAVRWHAVAVLENMLTLYPGTSLLRNIGADGSGRHVGRTSRFEAETTDRRIEVGTAPAEESAEARAAFKEYFRSAKPGLFDRLATAAKRALGK
ncbi:MAG: glycosyltransferase [Ignavibacteriales bacterium]|nr:glycosyltransferase [Ignavibacteriales bacterium]